MASRRVLVLGATGGTGQQVVSQALSNGHQVTAFVRHPEKVAARHDALRVIAGALEDAGALVGAMRDQDVVISALGRGQSFNPEGLMARCVPVILSAMTQAGARRLIFTSAFGVGEAVRGLPFLPRLFARTLLRGIYADKAISEAAIRASALDWTIVQPSALTNRPATGRYRSGEHLDLSGLPSISRADVAAFILSLLDDPSSVKKTLVVTRQ